MLETSQKKFYSLTYPQKSIILTEQFFNDPHISTISGRLIIKGPVDYVLLEKAILQFISNHDAFKLRFTNINGEFKQYFSDEEETKIEKISVKDIDELENILIKHTFTLLDSKLYFAIMFETDKHEKGYAFTIHHAITDAWSETIIINQINLMYNALLNNESIEDFPKTSYLDAINAEENYLFSNKFVDDKRYWEENFNTSYELPEVRGNQNKFDTVANRLAFPVPQKYFDYCSKNKISPFSFLLTAIFIYFSRHYDTTDLIIGTPVLNRTNYIAKNIFGMFISTQPFKPMIDENLSVSSFIANINSLQFSLLRHQKYPFELLQKYYSENFDRNHNLYDILFSYQNAAVDKLELSFEFETKWIFSGRQADALDISIYDIDNTGEKQIGYDYLVSLFTKKEILQMHNRIFHILDQMINSLEIAIKNIEIVTDEEKKILVDDFNNTRKDYDINLTISKLFEEQAKKTPNNVALTFDDQDLTYKEVNEKANSLAAMLREKGLKNNDIIGIMAYRSFEMVISQLAILKAGCAYLPIDPSYPKDRVSYILADSNCPILLTTADIDVDTLDIPYIIVDHTALGKKENLKNINNPTDLAYIIYTSGSTGKPKGVMLRHKSIINTLLWRKETYNFDPSYTTLQVPSFSFDSSVEDIFTTLISGGRLILLKQNNTNFDIPQIKVLIKKYKVNHFLVVPSFYNILLDELADELKDAKAFTVAGEGFSEELVKKHYSLLPNVKLYNEYGPTENSVCSTYYLFDKDHTQILIGKPIYNCSCYVLNKNLKLQPYGVKGELYLSGAGLSKGYIGRDDLNASRFIPNPFKPNELMYKTGDIVTIRDDGNMTFIERADFQVKYNGYRINLGEIESTISKHLANPNVVALLKKQGIHSCIAAYIESKKDIDVAELRATLSKFLPHYMIPAEIHVLAKFPTTPNGKINRKELEKISLEMKETKIVLPRNTLDSKILECWKSVLKLDNISIDSNIFELGGDSLSIIAIQALLFKYDIHTKVQDLFEHTTIMDLSDFIQSSDAEKDDASKITNDFSRKYTDDISNLNTEKTEFPKNILLTGVTGFLGAHILNSILEEHPETNIYCIIREKPDKTSDNRLKEILKYYFEEKWNSEIKKHIFVLKGDLSRDMFALNPTLYHELCVKIDSVINCASLVKHFGIYDKFYQSNVLSVENLIKFAKEANCSINHISTTSVSGNYLVKNDIEYNYTENDFYIGQNYFDNVYVKSKFEAEKLLFEAQKENININIFRIGNIMPRISDGKFQWNRFDNAYYKRIYGFIRLGILPENLKNQEMEFTPVDSCASAIVKLLPYKNKVFHLLNNKTIKISQLINVLNTLGYNIQFISIEKFNENIKKNTSNKILESFITDLDNTDTLNYDAKIIITSDITEKYFEIEDFSWPQITNHYLKTFLENMIREDYE